MSNKNNGGPAYPRVDGAGNYFSGISLRDYFAAKAMQGEFASQTNEWYINDMNRVAIMAYSMADAMLKVRDED